MATFNGSDAISGKEARLFYEGEELAWAKKFEAKLEKDKAEIKILGRRMRSYKTVGVKGSGTLTLYKVTSKFQKMMLHYLKTGRDVYFQLQEVLDDPGAGAGTERVTFYDVNIDSVVIGQFDVDSEALEEEIPFTFEDVDMPEELIGSGDEDYNDESAFESVMNTIDTIQSKANTVKNLLA